MAIKLPHLEQLQKRYPRLKEERFIKEVTLFGYVQRLALETKDLSHQELIEILLDKSTCSFFYREGSVKSTYEESRGGHTYGKTDHPNVDPELIFEAIDFDKWLDLYMGEFFHYADLIWDRHSPGG